jgi:hypothetical protein
MMAPLRAVPPLEKVAAPRSGSLAHHENVAAWAGVRSREGEAIIVIPDGDGLRVAGRVVLN